MLLTRELTLLCCTIGGVEGSEQCALPLRPVEGGDAGDDGGIRFGSQPYSRLEFSTLPESISVK